MLIFSLLAYLKSRQIDYVNAFTQAPADYDIFMSIPASLSIKDNLWNSLVLLYIKILQTAFFASKEHVWHIAASRH